MEVSSHSNNYQAINAYQKSRDEAVTLTVEPSDPKYTASEVYEASNGNLISDKEGNLVLTPQGQNNINNAVDAKKAEADAAEKEKDDALRGVAVDYTAAQSVKSQVEIYLAVATDNKVELSDDSTVSILESLRDVQKQNNAVEAYATYKENQQAGEPALFG